MKTLNEKAAEDLEEDLLKPKTASSIFGKALVDDEKLSSSSKLYSLSKEENFGDSNLDDLQQDIAGELVKINKIIHDEKVISDEIKSAIEAKLEASMVCVSKPHNPHYFSVVYANKIFHKIFEISEIDLVGKNYDFFFSDIDLDHNPEDRVEYSRLIKAVKDFHECSILINSYQRKFPSKIKFRVCFIPYSLKGLKSNDRYAIFTFDPLNPSEQSISDQISNDKNNSNLALLRNLERSLRIERLLREVGSLIISDFSISEVAQKVAQILCEHFKCDRCLIHDYSDSKTSFVVEHCNSYTKGMLDQKDEESIKKVTRYINFQNHFYEKFGDKVKRSSLSIIDDIESDYNLTSIKQICKEFKISSQIAVTTIIGGQVNGGIYLHQSDRRTWLEDEVELIEIVADQVSMAIDRATSVKRMIISNHALIEKTAQLHEALKHEQEMHKMHNEFVALMSHEFKTPLQIIDSTRELIVRKIKNLNIVDDVLDNALNRIKSGIQRMNGLIHGTLNLARMESSDGKIKVEFLNFNLKDFVKDVIEKNSNLAQNNSVKISSRIDELPESFLSDPKLLDHVLNNVVSNAIKYSKSGGSVKIIAKLNHEKVALRVIDSGIGIPQEDLVKIGTKFFRAKNTLSVAGTGIGLYLTKYFIELLNGEFLIESEQGLGTSVTIILPIKNFPHDEKL